MEEIRSTEVLEREILEDARKKAQLVLKTADDTLTAQNQNWEERTQEAIEEIRKIYAERTEKTREEIFARLSLDKRRLRSETAENFLVKAMDDFISTLSRETLISILQRELVERLDFCADDNKSPDEGKKLELIYSGMELSEARMVLKNVLGSAKSGQADLPKQMDAWDFKEDADTHQLPSVIINTHALKITASVEVSVESLLKEKRAELAVALLGEGVLND